MRNGFLPRCLVFVPRLGLNSCAMEEENIDPKTLVWNHPSLSSNPPLPYSAHHHHHHHHHHQQQQQQREDEEEDLHRLLLPDPLNLPLTPPSAIDSNFVSYFAPDFIKPGHDQYVYRHPNGLCIIGLAITHVALREKGGVMAVDFNVGKSDRSEIKVTGKRKKNAHHFEPNTALCKVSNNDSLYTVRCCVKGSLLEVNDRLIKQPELLSSSAAREGYIAIIMPKPADWLKVRSQLLNIEEFMKLRDLC